MQKKLRCVGYKSDGQCFTKGKIYTWEDDNLVDDTGFIYNYCVKETDINDWELSKYYVFEKVDGDSEKMSDREVWDMLKDKMEKNDITGFYFESPSLTMYGEGEMMQAVALAYRAGYKRAEKGRPFKYGGKTKKSDKFVTDKSGNKVYYCDKEVKIGDRVVFISYPSSPSSPWPEHGTVGVITDFTSAEQVWVLWEGEEDKAHNWRRHCKKVVTR